MRERRSGGWPSNCMCDLYVSGMDGGRPTDERRSIEIDLASVVQYEVAKYLSFLQVTVDVRNTDDIPTLRDRYTRMVFEFPKNVMYRERHHSGPEVILTEGTNTELVEAQHHRGETERSAESKSLQETSRLFE